jgi:hypothetical protein
MGTMAYYQANMARRKLFLVYSVVIVALLGIVVSTIGSSAAVRTEVVSKVEPILDQIRLS